MNTKNEYEGTEALNTPYGAPSPNAYTVQVPNECVGMIIGKDGQTLKMIEQKSGAHKVLVATSSAPGIDTRNVFVEGDEAAVAKARKILEGMVESNRASNLSARIQSSFSMDMEVPNSLVGLVIGKNGENIKGINGKTGAFVSLAKEESLKSKRKIIRITGPENLCYAARYEVDMIVQNGLKNLQNTRPLTPDEMSMIKPVQFYPQQFEGVSFVD
jgi:far upstream element-binding protein